MDDFGATRLWQFAKTRSTSATLRTPNHPLPAKQSKSKGKHSQAGRLSNMRTQMHQVPYEPCKSSPRHLKNKDIPRPTKARSETATYHAARKKSTSSKTNTSRTQSSTRSKRTSCSHTHNPAISRAEWRKSTGINAYKKN